MRLPPRVAWPFSTDWILTYNSGYPVAKPDAIFTCGSYLAPNGQTAAQWFNNNPDCYEARPPYTLRNTEEGRCAVIEALVRKPG